MKRFLLILALLLIFIAILGSYYNQYVTNRTKVQTIQETQEMLRRTEALVLEGEAQRNKKSIIIMPESTYNELLLRQQLPGGQQNAGK
jgi:apolipoprotein N-acyltransferase